jgi:hypothetical protein
MQARFFNRQQDITCFTKGFIRGVIAGLFQAAIDNNNSNFTNFGSYILLGNGILQAVVEDNHERDDISLLIAGFMVGNTIAINVVRFTNYMNPETANHKFRP